jgi:arabinogalactan oligomer/maltooligosaccharide transport system permease protein
MFLMIFFEKIDFLGEILDKNDVKNSLKREIRNEIIFKDSEISKNKEILSRFNRFDLSNFIAVSEYRAELTKFESVKKFEFAKKNAMKMPTIILSLTFFMCLLFSLVSFFMRNYRYTIIYNLIISLMLIIYNLSLSKAIASMGLERKWYASWGLSESILHVFHFVIYIVFIAVYLANMKKINANLVKLTQKENLTNIKIEITKKIKWMKSTSFAYAMLAPAIIVVIVIIVYPFLYNFRISFSSLNLKRFFGFIQGDKLYYNGLGNYVEIFRDKLFWMTLLRTLIWTVSNLVFHVIGGVFLAIMLNRDMKFRPTYQAILILPWAIPQFIAVLVWRGMFSTRYGAINLFLTKIAQFFKPWYQVDIPWLTDPVWLFFGAILTNIWLGIPFMMMIALGGLQGISETYYEAAEIDGASSWQQIKHITLPQLKPVMTPAIIMGTVWTFNNLNVIYLLSTDTLTGKVDILVTYVYKAAFNLYRYGYAAAFSAVIFGILMMFSVLMIKFSKVEEGVN